MLKEDVDFQFVPIDHENEQAWAVRFLEGPHPETVVRYGNISFDDENDCLNFNFMIESTPDDTLTVDDVSLQEYAAEVLEVVLIDAIEKGSMVTKEPE